MFFKYFFVTIASLSAFSCSLSSVQDEHDNFLFEDGKLIVDCFNKDSSECLSKLATYQTVSRLHLQGFMFDEGNVKLLSNVICKMQLPHLTLDGCEINGELASLFLFHLT